MKKLIELINTAQLRGSRKVYEKESVIFLEGDSIGSVCIIESGSVRGEKNYPDGEMHIVEFFEAGDIFALEIAASRTEKSAMDYISNDNAVIRFVPMNEIEGAACSDEIEREITFELADENIRRAHKIEILAERRLRNRILRYLRVLQQKSGSNTVTVRLNREQMAKYLCVNRSALSNELSTMKNEGIVFFSGSKFTLLK